MILKVLRRDGKTTVPYNPSKIRLAISKANSEMTNPDDRIDDSMIGIIIDCIESNTTKETVPVEEIQDMIETKLMELKKFKLAKAYITYRYTRAIVRRSNTTDESILNLLKGGNDDVRRENSNKQPSLNSTQRDLIAGEVSKDITRRFLLPSHIIRAHDEGVIHFHDMDYFAQPEFNCCLPNFRDMLKNGTGIHGVAIETPKSFQVACTQVTQIMADISSNQYGGQTFYTDVLGEYLAYTRDKIRARVTDEVENAYDTFISDMHRIDIDVASAGGKHLKEAIINNIVDRELHEQLKSGVQTIQYQINTLMTTNGQSPFVTLFMYLREDDPYLEENAMIIEEILRQRITGVKNRAGVPVTPAFPKLIYVLTEQNCLKGGKFDYLTHLAAECTAKRMYPDYISEKVMKENYNGQVFGCMGCVKGSSVVDYRLDGKAHTGTMYMLWDLLSRTHNITHQNTQEDNWYIDVDGLYVWDTKRRDYTKVYRMIRNAPTQFMKVEMDNGYSLYCTPDHPFSTENRGVILAKDLIVDKDLIYTKDGVACVESVQLTNYVENSYDFTTESKHFEVNRIYSHNCRSFLSEWIDPRTGEPQWEGRFNQGVVTLNLPHLALDSGQNEDIFWNKMEENLSICFEALMCRHNALEGTVSDVSPIHWQDGGIARLAPGEKIDKYLHGGYSTISLGYIGLYECTKYMTGFSHTEEGGREFSLRVIKRLKAATEAWKASTGIGFGLYGTPAESTCYTLLKKDRKRFGVIKDITDKEWYTNSYHIDVREPIDAFTKLDLESIYQKISSGGAISYIEIPNLVNNLDAIESVIKFMYEHMQYAEFNTKNDYCMKCGFTGEIKLNEEYKWECPQCKNTNSKLMTIVRRTCGYLGQEEWNLGKTHEISERVIHLY